MAQRVVNDVLYLDVLLNDDLQELYVDLAGGEGGGGGDLPYYSGNYEVNPRKVTQTLETANKSMRRDVIVRPISYSETINESGGLTITIGQE